MCVFVCMCACNQGKPQLDPPEFSLSVLKQLKKERESAGEAARERLKTSPPGSGMPHAEFVCVCFKNFKDLFCSLPLHETAKENKKNWISQKLRYSSFLVDFKPTKHCHLRD